MVFAVFGNLNDCHIVAQPARQSKFPSQAGPPTDLDMPCLICYYLVLDASGCVMLTASEPLPGVLETW